MYIKILGSLLFATLLLTGCSGGQNGQSSAGENSGQTSAEKKEASGSSYGKEEVRKVIANIHGLYNRKNYKQLYGRTTQSMKEKLSEQQFTELVSDIRGKLGKVKTANISDLSNHTESGRVIVKLDVDYQNDSGSEKWTLVMGGENVKWAGFDYNAPSL